MAIKGMPLMSMGEGGIEESTKERELDKTAQNQE